MSPGPSPSAFQAALAGVSHGFATRRSSHTRQHAEPPPQGSDSSYGVRSLNSSVEWVDAEEDDDSDGTDTRDLSASRSRSSIDPARDQDDDRSDDLEALETSPTPSGTPSALPSTHSSSSETLVPIMPSSDDISPADDTAPLAAPPPTPRELDETPTPPAMTLRSPERSMRTPSPHPPPFPVATHALLDMLADAPSASEPSSPASLESYPSCIASLSSLSRTSSPSDWDWKHPLSRSLAAADLENQGLGLERDAELVLPTLSLPSTSLHLGLERWPGLPSGTRIALLSSPEKTRDVLGALATRHTCVQLAHGAVGVVNDGALVATILTGHSVNNVRQRTTEAYTALHSLLNSSSSAEQRKELEPMVASYSARADWVHLVVDLEDVDCRDLSTVVTVKKVDTAAGSSKETVKAEDKKAPSKNIDVATEIKSAVEDPLKASQTSLRNSRPSLNRNISSASSSMSRDMDETPRASHEPKEFRFPTPLPEVPELDIDASTVITRDIQDALTLLEEVLSNPTQTHKNSYEHFFAWRPRPTATSPSTSPASSAFDGTSSPAPLPTVTRASGEWEATLSRRLAHRRELDATARRARQPPSLDPRRRRRKSRSPKSECGPGPLFPRRHVSTAEIGLVDLFSKVFAPVKSVLARTSWKHMVVACAIAFAVGCGFWAARAS